MIEFVARQLRRLTALIALAAMLIGAPIALIALGGPLLPDHVPGLAEMWQRLTERDTGQLFLGFLVIVGIAAWAVFAIAVITDIAARIARRPTWHLPGLRLPQTAARALVGILIAGTITTSVAPAAAALPALPHAHQTVSTAASNLSDSGAALAHGAARHSVVSLHETDRLAEPGETAGPTWTVAKGDSLWSIAETTLGSGRRYAEIAALNQGRPQPDGRTLESARFLLPGWILHLPPDAHLPNGQGSAPASAAGADHTVVVEPGDILSQIALDEMGDAARYPEIAAANHIANPDLIHPGEIITIPAHEPSTEPANDEPNAPDASIAENPPADDDPDEATGPQEPEDEMAANSAHLDAEDSASDDPGALVARRDAESTPEDVMTIPATPGNDASGVTGESQQGETASSPQGAADEVSASEAGDTTAERTLLLGGVTTLAAALAWAGLIATRRRLQRTRHPGQILPQPSSDLAPHVERALRRRAGVTNAEQINRALRAVTPLLAECPTVPILGALIGDDTVDLYPATPTPPPPPLAGTDAVWTLAPSEPERPELFDDELLAALPTLATIGTTSDGRIAMLNLEELGAVHLDGDQQRAHDLVNHLVIELSQSPWTDGIHLHLADLPEGVAAFDADRIHPVTDLVQAVRFLAAHTNSLRRLLGDRHLSGVRSDTARADTWEPHLLIADGTNIAMARDAPVMIAALQAGPASASALVTSGTNPGVAFTIDIGTDGTTTIPDIFGAEAIKVAGAADTEIETLAALFTQRPTSAPATPATRPADDAASRLAQIRADGAVADDVILDDEVSRSVVLADSLPSAHDGFVTLHLAGAPVAVPAGGGVVGAEVDQSLDDDVVEWGSDTVTRPKIAILGTAQAKGCGPVPDRPQARQIEMAVYLALYSQGVTIDKFVTDLWPEDTPPSSSTRRVAISRLRTWLGEDPDSAEPFVPHGDGGYYLTDRLLDSELFTRLVHRSERRATIGDARDALEDLQRALGLVRGPILPEAGGPQYLWLAAADRMEDRTLPMAVVDAAHAATDLALAIGDAAIAESAAMTARRVEPYSVIPLCDLIRVAQYCGDSASAANWAKVVLTVSDAEVPAELPEHIQQLVADALPQRVARRPQSDGRR